MQMCISSLDEFIYYHLIVFSREQNLCKITEYLISFTSQSCKQSISMLNFNPFLKHPSYFQCTFRNLAMTYIGGFEQCQLLFHILCGFRASIVQLWCFSNEIIAMSATAEIYILHLYNVNGMSSVCQPCIWTLRSIVYLFLVRMTIIGTVPRNYFILMWLLRFWV